MDNKSFYVESDEEEPLLLPDNCNNMMPTGTGGGGDDDRRGDLMYGGDSPQIKYGKHQLLDVSDEIDVMG